LVVVASGEITATQNGVETQLAAGELFGPADQDRGLSLRVNGPEEAIALVVSLQGPSGSVCFWARDPLVHMDVLIQGPAGALPGGSSRLILERLTLPLGSTLPPYQASPQVWTGVESGVLGLTLAGQTPFLWESGQERAIRPGQPWPQIPYSPENPLIIGGTEMKLRNAGDDPLVLYRLMLVPGTGDSSATVTALGGTPLP
jgi:hypothetical protein